MHLCTPLFKEPVGVVCVKHQREAKTTNLTKQALQMFRISYIKIQEQTRCLNRSKNGFVFVDALHLLVGKQMSIQGLKVEQVSLNCTKLLAISCFWVKNWEQDLFWRILFNKLYLAFFLNFLSRLSLNLFYCFQTFLVSIGEITENVLVAIHIWYLLGMYLVFTWCINNVK